MILPSLRFPLFAPFHKSALSPTPAVWVTLSQLAHLRAAKGSICKGCSNQVTPLHVQICKSSLGLATFIYDTFQKQNQPIEGIPVQG